MAKYVAKVSSKIICSYAFSLEKEMTTHSRILAWRILWTEEPGGRQFMGHKEPETTEAAEHTRMHCSSAAPKPKPYFSVTWWSPSSSSVNRSSFQTEFWNLSQEIIILSMMIFLFMVTLFFLVTFLKNTYYLKSY